MATLVRYHHHHEDDLQSSIPSPFSAELLRDLQDNTLDELAVEPVDYDDTSASPFQDDIQTSVAAVQHSCLMTLANILSLASPPALSTHPNDPECLSPDDACIPLDQILAETPLSCIVRVLRARDGHRDRHDQPLAEAALLSQLHELVDAIAPSLDRRDAHLAQAIITLLVDLEQLPACLALTTAPLVSQSSLSQDSGPPSSPPYAAIASLQRQLSSLQPPNPSTSGSRPTPVESVRTALFWARIDEQLDTIVSLCRARASSNPHHDIAEPSPSPPVVQPSEFQNWNLDCRPSFDDTLPPEYDSEYYHPPSERPPSYVAEGNLYVPSEEKQTGQMCLAEQYASEKVLSPTHTSVLPENTEITTECDHPMPANSLDLDTITHAIERLYVVTPQLTNQRVELRRDKIMQMERAKKGKGKARMLAEAADPELDNMLELLGRASAREIPDQSAVIDPHRTGRKKGTANIEEQRRRYLEHLVHRTDAGRLHSQDAVPSLSRSYSSPSSAGGAGQVADDDQSSEVQPEGRGSRDGKRASYPAAQKSGLTLEPPTERSRNRSLSASHLAWLRPKDKSTNATGMKESFSSLSRSPSSAASKSVRSFSGRLRGVNKSRPPSTSGEGVSHGALDIAYVAEHHETLKHVILFITCASPSSSAPNGIPLAEVLPSTSSGTYGDCLFLRLAGTPSPPLALPVPVLPGSKTVLGRGSHWEVKAGCYQSGVPPKESEDMTLLPATELASLSPLSYTCSSCSLPLVPAPPTRYRDLPSEHWEELIDAWVCHPEGQTLAKAGMNGCDGNGKGSGFGFWPTCDEALVGGSYVLFDAETVAGGNIKCEGVREHLSRTLKKTIVVLPQTHAFPLLEALVGFEVTGCESGRYNTSKSKSTSLKQPSLPRTVCWGLHKRAHSIPFILPCILDLEILLTKVTLSVAETLAWHAVYAVLSWAGSMTGDRRMALFHACIGCSSMLFGQSVRRHIPKIPMSAFVLHDMLEHVQAHATYRFVLSDEEDERPRLLIWLFKPRIRISYMLPAPALLPKSGTIDASKVLYKILGPTSATSDFKEILNKYPGFPQAEYLFYSMNVCRKLAALLKESTASYPESMRTMTGLDVGWLTIM